MMHINVFLTLVIKYRSGNQRGCMRGIFFILCSNIRNYDPFRKPFVSSKSKFCVNPLILNPNDPIMSKYNFKTWFDHFFHVRLHIFSQDLHHELIRCLQNGCLVLLSHHKGLGCTLETLRHQLLLKLLLKVIPAGTRDIFTDTHSYHYQPIYK